MADERDPTERMRDPKISRRYLELGAEEPPRALDEAILAASRRAVEARPAPLVAPGGRRRWYFPLAAAAVIMLAVAVTLQVERQKPDDELAVASVPPQARKEEQKAPASPEQSKPAPKPQRAPPQFTPEPPPAAAPPSADAMRDLAKSNVVTAAQGARSSEAPAEARARGDAMQERAAAAPARREMEAPRPQLSAPMGAAASGQLQSRVMETPELALERIAELRKQGKHEEADKALAEFRKRYPDYRLSDEMRAKVEKK